MTAHAIAEDIAMMNSTFAAALAERMQARQKDFMLRFFLQAATMVEYMTAMALDSVAVQMPRVIVPMMIMGRSRAGRVSHVAWPISFQVALVFRQGYLRFTDIQ